MTVRRVGNYTVSTGTGRVFLVNDATYSDCDMSTDQAIALGEALLLAARESVRIAGLCRDEPPCMCAGATWSTSTPNHGRRNQ